MVQSTQVADQEFHITLSVEHFPNGYWRVRSGSCVSCDRHLKSAVSDTVQAVINEELKKTRG